MGEQNAKGRLIVLSGPSGVGKTTLCQQVLEQVPAKLSVSATTRKPRCTEVDGVDYYFFSPAQFRRKLEAGEFLESASVFGHLYGTPVGPVRAALDSGQTILLEIDVQGGEQVRRRFPDALTLFIMPPSLEAWRESLRRRLAKRGMNVPAEIERRLDQASAEIEEAQRSGLYDYFVVNDDLEQAVQQLVTIIHRELARND